MLQLWVLLAVAAGANKTDALLGKEMLVTATLPDGS